MRIFTQQALIRTELFYQLKSLEDGTAVHKITETEIESIAGRNDSRAISGPVESASVESPLLAQTSSGEDFVLQSEKHGGESVSQNATALGGLPAIIRCKVPALKTATHGVSTTGMKLQFEEQIVPSLSPSTTEVVPGQFGIQSGTGRGRNGDARVKKGNTIKELISLVLTGDVIYQRIGDMVARGTWWQG